MKSAGQKQLILCWCWVCLEGGKKEKTTRHCPRMGKLLQASGYEKSGNQTGPMDTKKNANGNLEKMEENTHKILLAQEIRNR